MKEVTWLKLCLSTNGHRSTVLWRLSFILPPVFVQAAVIKSWYEMIRPVCSLVRSINSFHNRLMLHHQVISQEEINSESWSAYQFLWICSAEFRYSFVLWWDELDFTHGQSIGSSVELSWHLRATSSELVATDAWSRNQGCWCHVTMMLISPGRWPFVFLPICWENTFSFLGQKSMNMAAVTEQTT